MKITIELTDAEVKGLKEYLRDVDGIEKPSREDIKREIAGIVSGNLEIGACGDYVKKYAYPEFYK